jgi:hypothetical protein
MCIFAALALQLVCRRDGEVERILGPVFCALGSGGLRSQRRHQSDLYAAAQPRACEFLAPTRLSLDSPLCHQPSSLGTGKDIDLLAGFGGGGRMGAPWNGLQRRRQIALRIEEAVRHRQHLAFPLNGSIDKQRDPAAIGRTLGFIDPPPPPRTYPDSSPSRVGTVVLDGACILSVKDVKDCLRLVPKHHAI